MLHSTLIGVLRRLRAVRWMMSIFRVCEMVVDFEVRSRNEEDALAFTASGLLDVRSSLSQYTIQAHNQTMDYRSYS